MEIREAKPADIPAIVALNDEVHGIHVRLFPAVFKPTDPAALAEWFGEWLNDAKTKILVASVDGGLQGYLTLRKEERPAHVFVEERRCAYIDQVCVTENSRRQGVFRAMLAEAEQVARQWGMSRLELDVWSENTAAKQAFSRCGFQTYNEKMKLALDGPDLGECLA
jgi:GNAT superfamily N-acetyltransferase